VNAASIVLDPISASVPQARRFVADQLADLPTDTVDVARLLVSELVTNAVLHARTKLSLTVDRGDSSVSIQVADANPLLPVLRTHSTDAGTGRGLLVLERMASRWGSYNVEGGKIVWFEIHTGAGDGPLDDPIDGPVDGPIDGPLDGPGTSASDSSDADADGKARGNDGDSPGSLRDPRLSRVSGEQNAPIEKPDDIVDFRWTGLPLAELDLTAEHYDSVLREFHLVLEREPEARAAVPGRLISLMDELTLFGPLISSVEQDLEHGRRSGAPVVDVGLELPREIGTFALRLDNLLDESDAYCAAGVELLSLEPTGEVVALRKWLIGELVRQSEGHPPVAWCDSPWATTSPHHRHQPS
jgi:anti-sigma regulatory factor (Ser/Thr protein kinase)